MMQAVAEALRRAAFPTRKVRIERFAASIPKHEHGRAQAAASPATPNAR